MINYFAFKSCRRSVSDQNVEALGKYNVGEQEGCAKNVWNHHPFFGFLDVFFCYLFVVNDPVNQMICYFVPDGWNPTCSNCLRKAKWVLWHFFIHFEGRISFVSIHMMVWVSLISENDPIVQRIHGCIPWIDFQNWLLLIVFPVDQSVVFDILSWLHSIQSNQGNRNKESNFP